MRCGVTNDDPRSLYQDYVRDLVLVARCGKSDTRYLFLQRYAEHLSGLPNQLVFLSGREQSAVFVDAMRPRDGEWPKSLLGTRLAVPRWFRRRLTDPLAVWHVIAGYSPSRLEVDPVCAMIVDPEETPHHTRHNGVDVYFCCSHCRELFEQRFEVQPEFSGLVDLPATEPALGRV